MPQGEVSIYLSKLTKRKTEMLFAHPGFVIQLKTALYVVSMEKLVSLV